MSSVLYPTSPSARDRWILERRPARNSVDARVPYAFLVEPEVGPEGGEAAVATVFLTNRECPFRCLMCDLWQNTLQETVAPGDIPAQIRHALHRLPPARTLKLYNSGSFFDPRAIPPDDYAEIAALCAPFERVIVESHPAFLGERALRFRELIRPATLEVAVGLETAHPEILDRLNKRITLTQFQTAAAWLREHEMDLRVFLLLRPPWLSEAEGLEWACRSLDFAFEAGASVCAVIPTRAGNGAMEALAETGEWQPPTLRSLETALEYGLGLRRGRVFADVWDAERFSTCNECSSARIARLARMNREQGVAPPVICAACS